MGLEIISRESVVSAIQEFDDLGRDAMLSKYQEGKSKRWYINFDGKYDQKLILRAAHYIQTEEEFRKFKAWQARSRLRILGFTVVPKELIDQQLS